MECFTGVPDTNANGDAGPLFLRDISPAVPFGLTHRARARAYRFQTFPWNTQRLLRWAHTYAGLCRRRTPPPVVGPRNLSARCASAFRITASKWTKAFRTWIAWRTSAITS